MPEMVTHPHGQYNSDIPDPVNGEHLNGILDGKITVSVKCNEQERRNSQDFPSHKKCFKIARKDDNVIPDIEKQNCIEKPFVPSFPMQVHTTINCYKKC
jgi:hypothetical protein